MANSQFFLFFCLLIASRVWSQGETMQTDTAFARELLKQAYRLGKQEPTIDSAIRLTTLSVSIYKKYFGEEYIEVAKGYHFLAILYAGKGKPELSIEFDLKALAISTKIIGYNTIQVSNILLNLGQWYRGSDDETALNYSEECLALRKRLYGEIHPEVANVYANMALTYWEWRDYNKAIDYNLKSLSVLEQMPEKDSLAIANNYTGLANIYALLGEYDKVNQLYEKALRIRLAKLGFKNYLVARTYSNMGQYYFEQKRYEEAFECHYNALAIRQEIMSLDHMDIATSYNNLGLVLDATGQVDSAISCFQRTIAIREKKLPPNNPRIGSAYFNLAECYNHKSDRDQAIVFYKKALYIQIKNINTVGVTCILTLQAMIQALEAENRVKEIQELFNSLELEKSPVLYPVSLQGKIRLLQLKGQYFASIHAQSGYSTGESLEPYEEMDQLLSSDQYLSWPPDLRERFLSDVAQGYFSGALACIQASQPPSEPVYLDRAFHYSEKAKAFLLYGKLKDESAKLTAGIPDNLLKRERELYVRISQYENNINEEKNKGSSAQDSLIVAWSGKLFDLREALEDLKKTLEERYPRYYHLKYNLGTVSIPCLQDTLLQTGQALIEYFTGDSLILAYVVTRDTFSIVKIRKDFPLNDWVDSLHQAISGYDNAKVRSDRAREESISRYIKAAEILYNKLLKPLSESLPESLIIVPDGVMGYVPFEALLEKSPQNRYYFKGFDYFGKKHMISYCHSATLLREMRNKRHQHAPTLEFLGFAPYYTGDTSLLAKIYGSDNAERKDLVPLPNSGKELYAIQKIMGGVPYYGSDATETRFLQEAGKARIIHLATHARADNRVGDYAWLAFREIKDSIENELVFVRDLYNLTLNADLVVLSACETALGELKQGEGIISLARAFAYAGAKSILTTLWSVNDAQSAELMIHFYRNLKKDNHKNKKSLDKALWKAKMDYLEKSEGDSAHPFYWAAFIGIGF